MYMLKNVGKDVNIHKKQISIFAKYFKFDNNVTDRVGFSKFNPPRNVRGSTQPGGIFFKTQEIVLLC